jgi:hypothetical protein
MGVGRAWSADGSERAAARGCRGKWGYLRVIGGNCEDADIIGPRIAQADYRCFEALYKFHVRSLCIENACKRRLFRKSPPLNHVKLSTSGDFLSFPEWPRVILHDPHQDWMLAILHEIFSAYSPAKTPFAVLDQKILPDMMTHVISEFVIASLTFEQCGRRDLPWLSSFCWALYQLSCQRRVLNCLSAKISGERGVHY